jgi:metal-dependent amidase/aminoacylase/carboxypeptidase family protein
METNDPSDRQNQSIYLICSLGQGCGHNLIAISGVGAAMAIKAALESGRVKGKVILYGTPAEG